jgi:proteasome lid subunit RPN8/RPN11
VIRIEHLEDIKLFLTTNLIKKLKSCVQEVYPNEACGILFGKINQIKNDKVEDDYFYHYIAKDFNCIKSDQKSMVSFLIENIEKLHEIIQTKIIELEDGMRLISIFHSHPSGNYPSSTDVKNMKFLDDFSNIEHKFVSKAFKNLIWLIMDGSSFEIKGFIYYNSTLYQIDVKVRE